MSTTPPSDPTVAYYEARAEAFARDTTRADMAALYAPFLALVPPGGHILDAGCGAGRDVAAFDRMGYRVTAFDASPALARIAARASGVPVAVARLEDLDAVARYDGVWACASLLHLRRAAVPGAVSRLAAALVPGGALHVSFKRGDGEGERSGRHFTDYTAEMLGAELRACAALELLRIWESFDVRPGRDREGWVNGLARRTVANASSG